MAEFEGGEENKKMYAQLIVVRISKQKVKIKKR